MVDLRSSGRIFKQVKRSGLLTDLSHDHHACGNVLMHIDMFSGMYTSLGSGDILVRMCGSWDKIHGRSAQFRTHFQTGETLWVTYGPLTRPARMRKCSHAYRHFQWDID